MSIAFAWGLCVSAFGILSGCDVEGRGTPRRASAKSPVPETVDGGSASVAALTPTETIRLLCDYRDAGKYSRIEAFLPPSQRSAVVAQFRAVERLVGAVRLLQTRVRDRLGTSAAQAFAHYAQVGNIAGVFSKDVTLLSERIDGDTSSVTFQVADRVPLETIELNRVGERWVLDAEPIEGVAEQLLKLAFMLERMSARVMTEEFSVEALQREISLRQSGILRRLNALVSESEIGRRRREPKIENRTSEDGTGVR